MMMRIFLTMMLGFLKEVSGCGGSLMMENELMVL